MSKIVNVENAHIDENGRLTGGNIAQRLLNNGMDGGALRPWIGRSGASYVTLVRNGKPVVVPVSNATLRKDEWKVLDDAVLKFGEDRLIGVNDLRSRGLTFPLTNAMGTTVFEYEKITGTMEAQLSMDAAVRGEDAGVEFTTHSMPIPIVHADFSLNARYLASSRNRGESLDTTKAERASRAVAEKLEDMLFTNTTYAYGGGTIYSYINHPDRNTHSLTSWDDSSTSGNEIINMVQGMKQAAINAHFHGPYVLYVPNEYETKLDEDYTTNYPITIRERLLKLDGITDVRVVDRLATDNVLLVQMTPDVVRLLDGMAITPVEWSEEGGMILKFKVMAIQVPQIRSDGNGNCGIVHAS